MLFGEPAVTVTLREIDEAEAASAAALHALIEVYLDRRANPRGGATSEEFEAAMAEASSKHGAVLALLRKAAGIVQRD